MAEGRNQMVGSIKISNVGKQFTTFAVTEESDKKKPGTKESSYRFTPGYEIVEKLRARQGRNKA